MDQLDGMSLLFTVVISGCGGGSSSSPNSTTGSSTITGQFIDSVVSGLDYTCSSGATGKKQTNSNGEFTCEENDTVTFYLGEYVIGSSDAKAIVTPYDLYPDPEHAINVAQLLQSLSTTDPDSGTITIPADFSGLNGLQTAPNNANFLNDIATALSALSIPLEDRQVVTDHLIASLPTSFNGGSFEIEGGDDYSSAFGFEFSFAGNTLTVDEVGTAINGDPITETYDFDNVTFSASHQASVADVQLAKSANNQYLITGTDGFLSTDYRVLGFAINNGFTDATNAVADGEYKFLQLMDDDRREFSSVRTTAFDISFDGSGTLTWSEGETTGTISYNINPSGSMTFTELTNDLGQISQDGGVIMITKYNDAPDELDESHFIHLSLLIKKSSGNSNSTLNGTFTYAEIDAVDNGGSDLASDLISTYGTISFNGAGSCTVISSEASFPCTYSVADDGTMEFNDGDNILTGMVSPDGELVSVVHNEDDIGNVGPFMVIAVKQ